jgi:hypothetical protein
MGNITRVGVDIAKSIFHVHAVDRFSEAQWKGKYNRTKWTNARPGLALGRKSLFRA